MMYSYRSILLFSTFDCIAAAFNAIPVSPIISSPVRPTNELLLLQVLSRLIVKELSHSTELVQLPFIVTDPDGISFLEGFWA